MNSKQAQKAEYSASVAVGMIDEWGECDYDQQMATSICLFRPLRHGKDAVLTF